MNSAGHGELSQALETLLKYLNRKGQLPSLQNFVIISIVEALLNAYTDIKVKINWDKLVELSINSPPFQLPLWIYALDKLSRLGAQTNIITELAQRKPLLSLSK
jgi:hypothetical protein